MKEQTFPGLVDEVIGRSGRLDRLMDIVSYANTTVRECQGLAMFWKDFEEEEITATATPHIWNPPQLFYKFRTVKYPAVPVYPKFIYPGKTQERFTHFFYGGGSPAPYFAFAGVGAGDKINLGYYKYLRRLIYYQKNDEKRTLPGGPYAIRPARFLVDEGDVDNLGVWEYWNGITYVPTLNDTGAEELARNKVAHWMVFTWFDLIVEGTMAKLLKSIGDEDRAKISFSLYSTLQQNLLKMEPFETLAGTMAGD